MSDWRELVRERVAQLQLSSEELEDVVAELADHLEETSAQLREQGVSCEDARKQALEQVSDWNGLAHEIQSAREGDAMNDRTRSFWLPGMLTLILTMGFLLVLQFSSFQPRAVTWENRVLVLFYFPWLVSLPVFGALGAFLSLRAGGSPKTVLLSSVFPASYLAVCFFVILPLSILFNHNVATHFRFDSLFPQLFAWFVLPLMALLFGGIGVLLANRRGGRVSNDAGNRVVGH